MTPRSSSTASLSCCLAAIWLSSAMGSDPVLAVPAAGVLGRLGRLASGPTGRLDVDGVRAGRPSIFAQLDQRQLVAGDLDGAGDASSGRDLHQLVGVREGVLAQRHELAHLGRRVREPEPVLEVALVLAELLASLRMLYPCSRSCGRTSPPRRGEMSSRWRFSMIEISSAVSSSMSSTSAGSHAARRSSRPASGARRR